MKAQNIVKMDRFYMKLELHHKVTTVDFFKKSHNGRPKLMVVPYMQPMKETIRTVIFPLDDFCLHVNISSYSIEDKLTKITSSAVQELKIRMLSNCSTLYRLTQEPI
jgi:hypothetical protein